MFIVQGGDFGMVKQELKQLVKKLMQFIVKDLVTLSCNIRNQANLADSKLMKCDLNHNFYQMYTMMIKYKTFKGQRARYP